MVIEERNSFLDTTGRIFYIDNEVYRGITEIAQKDIEDMFECGLISELNRRGMIPHTEIAEIEIPGYEMVLHHEFISDPSYIYEWPFTMIKDAAMFILELEKVLLSFGYNLKDSHSYNVMFNNNRPVYVDIGSFIRFETGTYGIEEYYAFYDQILQIFTENPSVGRERLVSRFNYGLRYNYYYLYGFSEGQKRYEICRKELNRLLGITTISEMRELVEKEAAVIGGYKMNKATTWGAYQDGYADDGNLIESEDNARFVKIVSICKELGVESVLEIGTNQGYLSRMLCDIPDITSIVATDYDENAVDYLYNFLKSRNVDDKCRNVIHPLVYDFTCEYLPSITIKRFADRVKGDVVIACALTHHLILSQYIHIDSIFEKFYGLTNKYIIIEFMPLGLWDGGDKLPGVPAWYNESWFAEHMEKLFVIKHREELLRNRILFVGEKREL